MDRQRTNVMDRQRTNGNRRTARADEQQQQSNRTALAPDGAPARHDEIGREVGGGVAELAYRKFEARGYEHGHDVEDWLDAERELNGSAGERGAD